jgi:hypothetical protein
MKADWDSWFLDGKYEKSATSLLNTLAKRFPKHRHLEDIGPCVRLVYDSKVSDEFGMSESQVLVHAFWGFEPVDVVAISRIAEDNQNPGVRRTIIGARFAPAAIEAARTNGIRCVLLDEIYFVNDSYAALCRSFLEQWNKEKFDRHLSSVVDLDFRLTTQRTGSPSRQSIVAFLEEQLKQSGKSAILVHGDFGCGKTTTAKQLVAELCEEYLKGNTTTPKVLYINVNNMDIRSRRDECLEAELRRNKLGVENVNDVVQQVMRDEIHLIFDGVDEMARPHTESGRKEAIELLRDVGNRRSAIYLIRSSYYPELQEMISGFSRLAAYDFKSGENRSIVIQVTGLRSEQVNQYLDSRLGQEAGKTVRSTLNDLGFQSFLSDPLIVSLICRLVEEEGDISLKSLPRDGGRAHFLGHIVDEMLKRELEKRQRHGGLAGDPKRFQRVLHTVAFSMICKGTQTITPSQLRGFINRAWELASDEDQEAVDAFRTMAWIHRSAEGELAFRHEALTLVCAAQYINRALESRSVIELGEWQSQAPLADIVCKFAGETIRSWGVLGATEMLSSSVPFNVLQVIKSVLRSAAPRNDFIAVPETELDERAFSLVLRGIKSDLSLADLPIRILTKSLSEKRFLQMTVIVLWFLSKTDLSRDLMRPAIDLVRTRVRREWNFCDDLRELKEDPGTSFDSMLLKDLSLPVRNLVDSTEYEPLFKKIYACPDVDTPTKQFSERTLKGIEGEKRRLSRFRQTE